MWENYEVFFIGCVGAIAPEISRLYELRDSLKISWSWGYVLISIAFVLLGGFITSILEPSNNYAALYCGVGTPYIINAIAKKTQQAATPKDIPVVKHSDSNLDTEAEITRVEKGKRASTGTRQLERETLEQIASERGKFSLRKFLSAL